MNDTTSLARRGECILRAMQLDRPDLAARLAVGWGDMAERRRVASLMRYVARKRLEEDAALNAAAAGVSYYSPTAAHTVEGFASSKRKILHRSVTLRDGIALESAEMTMNITPKTKRKRTKRIPVEGIAREARA